MKYTKIHIIGGSGSGKSYLAKRLQKTYNLTHLDLDDIFWDNTCQHYGQKADKKTRMTQLESFLKNNRYVIEGVYHNWLSQSFSCADIIIVLDVNIWRQSYYILKRFFRRKLKLEQGKKESLKSLYKLIKWNIAYKKEELLPFYNNLPQKEKAVFFKNADTAYRYIYKNNK